MEIAELAERMAAGAGNHDRSKNGQYYMLNINHPVVFSLMRRYCDSKNINLHLPLSDTQRFEFELWALQPSIRNMVEELVLSTLKNEQKKE